MTELLQGLSEKVKELGTHGAAYTVAGSFLLYVLGYLALRFHLTVLGIGTDLAVLDERYLFAGTKFIVYLCTMVPILVLLVLLSGGTLYGAYRILPAGSRASLGTWLGKIMTWVAQPSRLLLGGIVFSVCMIQFFMRHCFTLSNVLLRPSLPVIPNSNLDDWLLLEDSIRITLFFLGLMAGCAISGLILLMLRQKPPMGDFLVFSHYLFVFLVAIQVLLLPVNYGCLVQDKWLPRVASLDGSAPLAEGMEAWLVWEGKEGITYLVRNRTDTAETKSLVTLPRGSQEKPMPIKITITAYDYIFSTLFASKTSTTPCLPLSEKK